MNLKILSDDQLHSATVTAAKREREETIGLLKHLSEIERRRLFSKFNCDSLHAYCVHFLKMSDPQAGRRVSASRLLNELPVIEEKVRTGSMTLTSLCQANTFFRKEAAAGNKFAGKEKLELINQLEGQASRKVEQILLSKSEQPEIHLRETVKQKTEGLTEIKLLVDEETLSKLNRLKEILSHQMPNATYAQIISKLAAIVLEKLDPESKAKRAEDRKVKADLNRNSIPLKEGSVASKKDSVESKLISTDLNKGFVVSKIDRPESKNKSIASNQNAACATEKPTPAPERVGAKPKKNFAERYQNLQMQKRSRHIPAAVRHAIWLRDRGCCTFKDSNTGEACESRKWIEIDHLISFAQGGEHTLENLRLRCRAHNQRHAIETFGFEQVSRYWQRSKPPIETIQGAGSVSKS